MLRTLRVIRRTIRAALHAGQHLITAVRGAHYRLFVALYTAIDAQATVRIVYRDRDGVESERCITPQRLWPSQAGDVLVTAWDHRDGDQANFRTDRIRLAA